MKSRTGFYSRNSRAMSDARPLCQVCISQKMISPDTSGTQPPSSSLVKLASRNATSMMNSSDRPVRNARLSLPVRVAGTSIFLDQKASGIPRALLNNIKFNRVMHERVVLLTVVTREVPRVAAAKRLTVTPVCEGIVRVVAQVGFMEKPDITAILRDAENHGVPYDPEVTTYFLSREELLPGRRSDLPPLRRKAFMQLARSAQVIGDYYGLPPNRVVEIGTRLEI